VDGGAPLFVRTPQNNFTLPNFMRSHIYASFAAMKIGLDLLLKDENVPIEKLFGHGGLFKAEGVAQQMMASALNTPVQITTAASEGGAWGMAILAEYMHNSDMSLADYLQNVVFANAKSTVCTPNPDETAGFNAYLKNYKKAIEIEKTAVKQML